MVGGAFLILLFYGFVVAPILYRLGMGNAVDDLSASLLGMFALVGFGVFWFYGAFMETYRNGQTWGKRAANIQVLSVDGYAIDGIQAMSRNLFRYLDILPFVPSTLFYVFNFEFHPWYLPTCLIGLICMTVSPRFQRIGDLIAGTMVVLVEKKWVADIAQFEDQRVAQLAEMIPNSFQVSASMANALATYGDARPRLTPAHRHEIAAHLANPLKEKFDFPQDTDNDLLLCALYYRTYADIDPDPDDGMDVEKLSRLKESRPAVKQNWDDVDLKIDVK